MRAPSLLGVLLSAGLGLASVSPAHASFSITQVVSSFSFLPHGTPIRRHTATASRVRVPPVAVHSRAVIADGHINLVRPANMGSRAVSISAGHAGQTVVKTTTSTTHALSARTVSAGTMHPAASSGHMMTMRGM